MNKLKIRFLIFALVLSFICPYAYAKQAAIMGKTVGIKLYTDGICVTGIGEFLNSAHISVSPAKDADIRAGDIIRSVDGQNVSSPEDMQNIIGEKPVTITLIRGQQQIQTTVTPVLSEDNTYKIGLWLRDSCAGIGTLTCIDPDTDLYYALGHAITDIDTGNIMTVNRGSIQNCNIFEIAKSRIGSPGSLSADFCYPVLGDIKENKSFGISGHFDHEYGSSPVMEIASSNEIKDGDACILTDVIDQTVKPYSVRIRRVSDTGEKNLIVEICDDNLKCYTGGIVQGMSGAPIIQNNKLIGAITHVFVNNPKCGYGIMAEKFLN